MNCWKSINLIKQYGGQRLFIVSILIALLFFMSFFSMFQLTYPNIKSTELGPLPLLFSAMFALPAHKVFHCIPLWITGKKAKLVFKPSSLGFMPMIFCNFSHTITRNTTMVLVLFPMIAITGLCITGAVFLPELMPLFITFAAVNIGLSYVDWLYFLCLLKAPRWSLIEDHHDGFSILIKSSEVKPTTMIS